MSWPAAASYRLAGYVVRYENPDGTTFTVADVFQTNGTVDVLRPFASKQEAAAIANELSGSNSHRSPPYLNIRVEFVEMASGYS